MISRRSFRNEIGRVLFGFFPGERTGDENEGFSTRDADHAEAVADAGEVRRNGRGEEPDVKKVDQRQHLVEVAEGVGLGAVLAVGEGAGQFRPVPCGEGVEVPQVRRGETDGPGKSIDRAFSIRPVARGSPFDEANQRPTASAEFPRTTRPSATAYANGVEAFRAVTVTPPDSRDSTRSRPPPWASSSA